MQVSRAFTCYQLAAIVERLSHRAETLNCAGIVCLGLLGTLYDEDVAWPEAQRLLHEVIAHLKMLARTVAGDRDGSPAVGQSTKSPGTDPGAHAAS